MEPKKQVKTSKSKSENRVHADHSESLVRLKRIKGQLDGVERMIEDGRYCMEIVSQIRSIMAALKSVEGVIMERHLRHCVSYAIQAKDERVTEEKISELVSLFRKR